MRSLRLSHDDDILKYKPHLFVSAKRIANNCNICSKFLFESVVSSSTRSVFKFQQDESTHMVPESTYVALGSACIQQSGGGVLAQQTKNNIQAEDNGDNKCDTEAVHPQSRADTYLTSTQTFNLPYKRTETHCQTQTT